MLVERNITWLVWINTELVTSNGFFTLENYGYLRFATFKYGLYSQLRSDTVIQCHL